MADNLFDTWDPEPSSEASDTLHTSNRIPKRVKVEIRGNHSIVTGETLEISPLDLKIRITDERFLTREILASPVHCRHKIEQELAYGLGVHFPELDVTYTGRVSPQGGSESGLEDASTFVCTLDREMESATFLMLKKLNEQSKELEEIKSRKAELNHNAQAGGSPGSEFNLNLSSGAAELDHFFDRIESSPSGGKSKKARHSEPAQDGEVYRVEVVGEYKTFKAKAYHLSANNILIHIASSELRVPDGPGRSVFINKVITDHFLKGMVIRFLGTDFSKQANPVGLSEITDRGEQLTVIDCKFKTSLSLDDLAGLEGAERNGGTESKTPGATPAMTPEVAGQAPGPAGAARTPPTAEVTRSAEPAGDAWPPFATKTPQPGGSVGEVQAPLTPEVTQGKEQAGTANPLPAPDVARPAEPVGVAQPPPIPEAPRTAEPLGAVQGTDPMPAEPAADPHRVPHTAVPIAEPERAPDAIPSEAPVTATAPSPAAASPEAAAASVAVSPAAAAPPVPVTSPAAETEKIRELLKQAVDKGATDLHIRAGRPPRVRVSGDLVDLGSGPVTQELCHAMALGLMTPEEAALFEREGDVELGCRLEDLGHFRVSVFRQRDSTGLAVRCLQRRVPTIESMGLHPLAEKMCEKPDGLVLVTGSAGSGKTTTLAALVDQINRTRPCHIITIEDPIEYRHEEQMAQITQREIGRDALEFSRALRCALRQDPDVILVGEMGDPETIALALNAAEKGYLVLAALNAPSAAQALARAVEGFPPERHGEIRTRLAEVLEGILTQQLVFEEGGQGAKLVQEAILTDHAVCACIRENKLLQITEALRKSAEEKGEALHPEKTAPSPQTVQEIKAAQTVRSQPDAKPAQTIEDTRAAQAAQNAVIPQSDHPTQPGQTSHPPQPESGALPPRSEPGQHPQQPEPGLHHSKDLPEGHGHQAPPSREEGKPGP